MKFKVIKYNAITEESTEIGAFATKELAQEYASWKQETNTENNICYMYKAW